jgi:CheY-like chemotaxis protein
MVGDMPYKLLLADDSVTIQRVIELTFADEDVSVIAVGDGQQAIDRIEAEPPDIVLADVGMPSRDGYQVATYVKTTPRLAHIPVLLLTGAFEPVDEERARAAACDGVLAKPFEPQMVIARVKELLAASAGHSPAPVDAQAASAGADFLRPAAQTKAPASELDKLLDAAATAPAAQLQAWQPEGGSEPDFRIRRRPSVLAEASAPIDSTSAAADTDAAATGGASPLDDYFDRLDAAFATLSRPAAGLSIPPVPPAPGGDQDAGGYDDLTLQPNAAADLLNAPLAPRTGPETGAAAFGPPVAAPAAPLSSPESARSPVAQAFSALLAAESGDDSGAPVASFWPGAGLSSQAIDEIVERVTQDVLDKMTDRVVRETVTEVVSRITERLIREEIDRVKATIK